VNTLSRWLTQLWGLWATTAALALGAGLILLSGRNPVTAYATLFGESLLDYYGLANTLVKMCPLVLTGLAVILPLRAGLYNVGGEGQMYMGALLATIAALYGPAMPWGLSIVACSACGMLGGAVWGMIPAVLKAYRGTNEVIVTLLMNYVAINLVSCLVSGPLMEPGAPYPYSPRIEEAAQLPQLFPDADAHAGVLVGVVLAIGVAFVFRHTSVGFGLRALGSNPRAASYAGMPVRRYLIGSLACGGAFAGLAGAYEVMGLKHRLYHLFGGGYGYDGIVVAFLAGGRPLWGLLSALFIAILKNGGNLMQRGAGVPVTIVETLEGLLVVLAAMCIAVRNRYGKVIDDQAKGKRSLLVQETH